MIMTIMMMKTIFFVDKRRERNNSRCHARDHIADPAGQLLKETIYYCSPSWQSARA